MAGIKTAFVFDQKWSDAPNVDCINLLLATCFNPLPFSISLTTGNNNNLRALTFTVVLANFDDDLKHKVTSTTNVFGDA